MMKNLLLIALGTTLCGGMAMADDTQLRFLEEIHTQSGVEKTVYTYNDLNKVSEILLVDEGEPRMSHRRFLSYDDNGNCIGEEIWQDYYITMNPEAYVKVQEVAYEYDENNRVTKRTTYGPNISSGLPLEECDFIEQSILEFYYDFWGDLATVNTLFSGGAVVQRDDYMWDEYGHVLRRDSYDLFSGTNELISSLRYEYSDYSADAQLLSITNYANDQDGVEYVKDLTDYIYDNDGLLATVEVYSRDRENIVSRDEYTYRTDFTLEETVYPTNFEDNYWVNVPEFSLFERPVSTKESFVVNDQTYRLEYLDTYTYLYAGDEGLGVRQVAAPGLAASVLLRSVSKDRVELSGVAASDHVRVLDMQGATRYEGIYGNGIEVTALPAGAYIIMVPGSAVSFAK